MTRNRKILLGCCAMLVAGFLFTAFILPTIVRSQLEQQVGKATGRVCSVRSVAINPLNWSVKVRGVRLGERDNRATFVSFSSLGFRVSPTSVFRLAPVVNDLKLHAPYVHVVRTGPNSFNFTDIIERQPPKKKDAGPARFSLNNIVLDAGRVDFEDLAPRTPTRHTVTGLDVQIPFISNISYFADRYVDPSLSAVVNGAPFRFGGKLKPFAKGMEATVRLDLKDLDIPYYAAYFPTSLPVAIGSGTLSTALEISHRLVQGGKPDLELRGTAGLQGVRLAEKSGKPLLGVNGLEVAIARAELLKKEFDITSLTIDGPELTVSREKDGRLNVTSLAPKAPAEEAKEKEREQEKPAAKAEQAKVMLRSLALSNGTVHFRDSVPPGGFATELLGVELEIDNLATYGETPAEYQLSFATARKEQGEVSGDILLAPLTMNSQVSLSGLVLEAAYPYLAGALTGPVKGRADFKADLAFTGDKGLTMEGALLRLKGVQVPFGPKDFLQLPSVTAEGGALRLKERTAAIKRITVAGGKAELSRDEKGNLSTSLLLRPAGQGAAPVPQAAKPAPRGKPEPPFKWQVASVAVNGFDAAFTDNTREDKPRFALTKIRAGASSLKGPAMGEIPFTFAAIYGGQGELGASGRVLPNPLKLKGDLTVKRLPLLDFESYLPEGVNVLLLDGKLDTRLAVDISRQGSGLVGSFRGDGGVRDFHVLDADEEEDLLKWESLQLDGINGTLSPFSLAMSGVSMNNYYARVIINKAGRMNLQDLYTPPARQAPAAPPPAAAVPAPAGGAAPKPVAQAVRIDSITLQDGQLDFSDHHLNRDFATTMLNLGGRVTGLSSEATTLADIDLRGNLENHSPLRIVGKINPLRGDLFLDMTINFSEIELSPMTPYSGTYLGYAIDKGKLSLALEYKIDQKKLSAQNRVFLDQFTFGDRIESKKATSLPVRLAVALLKDRKGEIHLDLPLSGRTDDPKFSIWGVIGQILKNLLVKAATSPFALLQSAFGSSEDFSGVSFAPGTSHLTAAEEGKLRSLAKVLTERPGIKLEIAGFADRERDPEGYRSELLLKKMKNEKFLALVKEKRESTGLSAETMEIPPEEQSRWLKAVYEKEKFPRPRTVIGTLKSLPDPEMRKLILANTLVGDQQLRQLARDRSVTVTNFLVREGKLPQDRLFEKSGDVFTPPKKEGFTGSRVEFGVVD
jgi:hypothetical protein